MVSFPIILSQIIDEDLNTPVKNRIDKKGLLQHYYRIREYSWKYNREEQKEERLFLEENPLEGKKVKYFFYFLYDGNDPILEKERHRISIGVYQLVPIPNEPSDIKANILFFNGQDIEKIYYHKTIRKELDEVMGYKKSKKQNQDSEEEPYDSPDEDDEVNDFYYLKRKEDFIAELIMKNYTELSTLVNLYNPLDGCIKLEWIIPVCKKGITKNKTHLFRLFQRNCDNCQEEDLPCLYPIQNTFTQDLGYLTIKEEMLMEEIQYLNIKMVFPSIKINYEYSIWCPCTTLECIQRTKPEIVLNNTLKNKLILHQKSLPLRLLTPCPIDLNKEEDRVFCNSISPKQVKEYGLNYRGRATIVSRKNFQMEYKFKQDEKKRIVLQTGKIYPDTYFVDYGYPYSTHHAFASSLAAHMYFKYFL
ncbi:unnamed protein product [Moneuplotes crassus]|uniref:Tubby C-terminal domain-containing protein n=1 Tax=Euplotes crassus TaxID=5936 RepID=A0AAD1UG77_EUPCR|nr:unnamed protein product [Moneuplotes crassus]